MHQRQKVTGTTYTVRNRGTPQGLPLGLNIEPQDNYVYIYVLKYK